MAFRSLLLATALLVTPATGLAQQLAALLPEETVFALGTEALAEHSGKFDSLLAEAERLELGEAFSELFGSETDLELDEELPAELRELRPLDLFGQEAWFAVSVSSYNPLPALNIVSRTDGQATEQVAQALSRAAEEKAADTAMEGEERVYLFPVEGEDNPFPVLAVSQVDGVVIVSTNPDVLRGILRRLAGSAEEGFTASSRYQDTLGVLGRANFYSFLDYAGLAESLEPLGPASGFEPLIARLLAGVGSIGTTASVMRIEEEGASSESIRVPGTGDAEVASLLITEEPASREPLRFVPDGALGISVSRVNLPGWWRYLAEMARSSDELGNPNLDELVMQFTGIDLQSSLFEWMGNQAATITTAAAPSVEPGVPSENLLGETVYLVQTGDEVAAQAGLSTLLGTISSMVAGFADPAAQGGAPAISSRDVAGVQVTSYRMAPGVTLAQAVTEGWALIATSDGAIDAALEARASGDSGAGELARLAREVPDQATSYSLADLGASLGQTGPQLAMQAQMFAGMAGGQLDFEALENATEAIESFFALLAERAGGSINYTVSEENGSLRSYGKSEFSW